MIFFGFIACGGIARHHASRLANVRGARIIACADTSAESAESFAAEFGEPGASTYTDYRRMLRRADLHAIWVCTPTFLHAPAVIAAAKAGKHIFCEKPMAMKPGDASMAKAFLNITAKTISGRRVIEVPLSAQDGTLYAGPLPLVKLRSLLPE